ncbi:polysaccharide deacetylase family protein [Aliihoeflea sp. 40Bstr573]|nr:polysaccharide deacetylase family protein [Aliihoeflea sp. 40Bstr573]
MTDNRERLRRFVLAASRWSGVARMAGPHLAGLGSILMLHSVTARPSNGLGLNDHLSVTPDFLDSAIADMKRNGFSFISLDEMIEHLGAARRCKVATITLDDAYLDNFVEALPVFESHAAPFAIFVAPGLIDGSVQPWWEVIEQLVMVRDELALPLIVAGGARASASPAEKLATARHLCELMTSRVPETYRQAVLDEMGGRQVATSPFMSWEQIAAVAHHPLGTIGAHTIHHYNLARLDEELALIEMRGSADLIAETTGVRPRHFAYPYGHVQAVGEREIRLAGEAGFVSAVTTRHGTLHPEHRDHLHALPRISLNGRYQQIGHLRTMLTGITTFANSRRRVVTL